MLFTSFPLLRGDVYKGLGAFFVVVLLLGFPPPPRKSPSPFIFYALEKQNWNKIKKKQNTTKPKHRNPTTKKKKKKRIRVHPFISPVQLLQKLPLLGADGVVQPRVGRGRRGGSPGPEPPLCLAAGCYISQVITSE